MTGNCKQVAWMPNSAHALYMTGYAGTAALGSVMAPPGTITPREHAALLAGRVQEMVGGEEDPEAMLAWATKERLAPAGLTSSVPPDPKGARLNLVYAMAGHLQNMGILISEPGTVPTTDNEAAEGEIEEATLEAWIEGVAPTE